MRTGQRVESELNGPETHAKQPLRAGRAEMSCGVMVGVMVVVVVMVMMMVMVVAAISNCNAKYNNNNNYTKQ